MSHTITLQYAAGTAGTIYMLTPQMSAYVLLDPNPALWLRCFVQTLTAQSYMVFNPITTAVRNTIIATNGTVVMNKDIQALQLYANNAWTTIGATGATGFTGATGPTGPPGASGMRTVLLVGADLGPAGAYTTGATGFVDVDATNLATTLTIPTGYALTISASIPSDNNTIIAVSDNGTPIASLNEQYFGNQETTGSLLARIAGDGASHTVALQYMTTTTAAVFSASDVVNGVTVYFRPQMLLSLAPSA